MKFYLLNKYENGVYYCSENYFGERLELNERLDFNTFIYGKKGTPFGKVFLTDKIKKHYILYGFFEDYSGITFYDLEDFFTDLESGVFKDDL